MKKLINTLIVLLLIFCPLLEVQAKVNVNKLLENADKATNNKNYTQAIEICIKALRAEPENNVTRLQLMIAHQLRGLKYETEDKEYAKAANEYRAILYYGLYFKEPINSPKMEAALEKCENALNDCYKKIHFSKSTKNRFYTAKLLDLAEEYPAAAYEYMQASKNKKYTEYSIKRVQEINDIILNKNQSSKPEAKKQNSSTK